MTLVKTPATFPRPARLLNPADYGAVFEQRKARRGRFFHLHIGVARLGDPAELAAPAATGARLGIAVPKKLLKTAVHRNLVKRIAREAFRQIRSRLEPRDYVLRLSTKLDPQRQPIDRKALAGDVGALLAGRLERGVPEHATPPSPALAGNTGSST